jgi:hypothetical protein
MERAAKWKISPPGDVERRNHLSPARHRSSATDANGRYLASAENDARFLHDGVKKIGVMGADVDASARENQTVTIHDGDVDLGCPYIKSEARRRTKRAPDIVHSLLWR